MTPILRFFKTQFSKFLVWKSINAAAAYYMIEKYLVQVRFGNIFFIPVRRGRNDLLPGREPFRGSNAFGWEGGLIGDLVASWHNITRSGVDADGGVRELALKLANVNTQVSSFLLCAGGQFSQ